MPVQSVIRLRTFSFKEGLAGGDTSHDLCAEE